MARGGRGGLSGCPLPSDSYPKYKQHHHPDGDGAESKEFAPRLLGLQPQAGGPRNPTPQPPPHFFRRAARAWGRPNPISHGTGHPASKSQRGGKVTAKRTAPRRRRRRGFKVTRPLRLTRGPKWHPGFVVSRRRTRGGAPGPRRPTAGSMAGRPHPTPAVHDPPVGRSRTSRRPPVQFAGFERYRTRGIRCPECVLGRFPGAAGHGLMRTVHLVALEGSPPPKLCN